MRIEGILREITKNHPRKHADICVCTHYLLFIYHSYAESRVFTDNCIQLITSDDRQESVFKYWWWENSQTNMTSFYKYSVHLLLILITLSNHIFFMNPMNGPNQHLPHCRTEDVKHTHRTFL